MAIPNRQGTRACHSHLSPWESYNLKSCFVFSYEVELLWYMDIWEGYYGRPILWQSLIGRGPWHAIPIFLLENHMFRLICFVIVQDSAMKSHLPFSSVLQFLFCFFLWRGTIMVYTPMLWQSLIGTGPRHAILIFLLENHMVELIRFVSVHDSAMQSRLPFSSVLENHTI